MGHFTARAHTSRVYYHAGHYVHILLAYVHNFRCRLSSKAVHQTLHLHALAGDGARRLLRARRLPHNTGQRPRAKPLGRPAAHVARAPAGTGRLPHGRRRLRAVAGASTRRQRGQRRRDARPRGARGRFEKYIKIPLRRLPRVGGPHGAATARERRARAAPRGRRRDRREGGRAGRRLRVRRDDAARRVDERARGRHLCGNQISGAPRHRRGVVPVAAYLRTT